MPRNKGLYSRIKQRNSKTSNSETSEDETFNVQNSEKKYSKKRTTTCKNEGKQFVTTHKNGKQTKLNARIFQKNTTWQ